MTDQSHLFQDKTNLPLGCPELQLTTNIQTFRPTNVSLRYFYMLSFQLMMINNVQHYLIRCTIQIYTYTNNNLVEQFVTKITLFSNCNNKGAC